MPPKRVQLSWSALRPPYAALKLWSRNLVRRFADDPRSNSFRALLNISPAALYKPSPSETFYGTFLLEPSRAQIRSRSYIHFNPPSLTTPLSKYSILHSCITGVKKRLQAQQYLAYPIGIAFKTLSTQVSFGNHYIRRSFLRRMIRCLRGFNRARNYYLEE
jgi:hypothetical protein